MKQAGGQGVQDECNQLGHQSGGSAVMTSGGNLAARHIIHLIPDSADKNHLQQCVEKCLGLAEARGIQSISFPAVGTGAFHVSAADSASLIFQALSRFNANFKIIRKVRIVVFQTTMLQAFQQEQQRHSLFSYQGGALPRVSKRGVGRTRVSRHGGLSVEVINGDLTQEKTDAIMNIISTDMNMQNAGELSEAILARGGQQIQQECSQMGEANFWDSGDDRWRKLGSTSCNPHYSWYVASLVLLHVSLKGNNGDYNQPLMLKLSIITLRVFLRQLIFLERKLMKQLIVNLMVRP